MAKLGYGPKTISLDQLKIGQASGVMMEGTGNFDRVNATGQLTLNSSAASLGQITALIAPFAPGAGVAAQFDWGRLRARRASSLTLDLDKNAEHADRASARAVLDLDAPQLKGITTITAKPEIAALRAIDLDALRRSEFGIESKLSSEQGRSLLALLGLDRADRGGRRSGAIRGLGDRRVARAAAAEGQDCRAAGLDAEAQGTAEPWARSPRPASISRCAASIWRRCSISSRPTRWRRTSACRRGCRWPAAS